MRRRLALAVLLVVFPLTPAPVARADPLVLPVVFHVAEVDGARIMGEAEADAWLAEANGHFAPAGFSLVREEVRTLPEGHAELANIRARRRLVRFFEPRVINVFVVDAILDPVPSGATRRAAAAQGFEPSGRLGGAHIPSQGRSPETYLIVKHGSGPLTLTHELGHFFSAPHHPDPENIMSYGRDRHRFDEQQIHAFRYFARRYLREGMLRRGRGSGRRGDRPAGS